MNVIRPMTLADCEDVAAIEADSFFDPWTSDGFKVAVERSDTRPFVFEADGVITGYMVLQIAKDGIHIMNFAIHPDQRRNGFAVELLRYAEKVARGYGAARTDAEVQASNMPAQLLLRKVGYKATKIMRNYYASIHEDGYRFELILNAAVKNEGNKS